jgi:hypothetical protein
VPDGVAGEVLTVVLKMADDLKKPDMAAFASSVVFKNEKQQEWFTRLSPIQAKVLELDNVVFEKFGHSLSELAREHKEEQKGLEFGSMMSIEGISPNQAVFDFLRHSDASDLQVNTNAGNADEASVTSKSGKLTDNMTMAKIDGAWKLQLDLEAPAVTVTISGEAITKYTTALDKVIADVKADKYKDKPGEMLVYLYAEIVEAMKENTGNPPK